MWKYFVLYLLFDINSFFIIWIASLSSFFPVVHWTVILNLSSDIGEFQGPALVAIMEGASLSIEEVSSLQLLPPWRLRDETLNYGLGLLSCYFICDLLSIASAGYFYMFDPRGFALSAPSSQSPAAKMFSLIGTLVI